MNLNNAVIGLNIGEEFNALSKHAIGFDNSNQQEQCGGQCQTGMADAKADNAHIKAFFLRAIIMGIFCGFAEESPQSRRKEKRDHK